MSKITDLSWLNLKLDRGITKEDVDRQTQTARAIIERLYGGSQIPGTILADEVGTGKTFVSLAVAAALFRANKHQTRVLVLATSRTMRDLWLNRWERFRRAHRKCSLPEGREIARLDDVARGISFASLEELKHTTGSEVLAALELAMRTRSSPRGVTRKLLRKQLFSARVVKVPQKESVRQILESGEINIPIGKLESFLEKNYDKTSKGWISEYAAYEDLKGLVFRSRRPRSFHLDLVILDEAHRLSADQRQSFLRETIDGRTTKSLFLTATPFSMSVSELYDRICDLFDAAGVDIATKKEKLDNLWSLLEQFINVVKSRDEPPVDLKSKIENELGKYLIRNTWPELWPNNTPRRISEEIQIPLELFNEGYQAYAMFSLEREFVKKRAEGRRSYITSNRETLCSSYSAVRDSNKDDSELFYEVVPFLPKDKECPKLEFAANKIVSIVKAGSPRPNKMVVFCARNPTIRKLREILEEKFAEDERINRERWNSIRNSLTKSGWKERWPKARLAMYLFPERQANEIESSIKDTEKLIEEGLTEDDSWQEMWRLGRRINWVMTITGEEEGRSISEVQSVFNLPGPPYVVICSKKAGESIDLHRWCRRIMHYDLHWNPATMEQRVGRIDRINSLAFRERKPIEICYFRIIGTYEDKILSVVRERMEMTRVLLGAGEWLNNGEDVTTKFNGDLQKYKLNFATYKIEKEESMANLASTTERSFKTITQTIRNVLQ